MTSIREQAREQQTEHFGEAGDLASEALQAQTLALSDAIDALSTEQRTLLIGSCAAKLGAIVRNSLDGPSSMAGSCLVGVMNYANETAREDAGYTSTGDRAVDNILVQMHEMVAAQMAAIVGEDRMAEMDAAAARVKERVAAGEDFDTAAADEASKLGFDLDPETGQVRPAKVEAPAASTGSRPDDVLYL
jgi:hypothetical protein